MPMNDNAAKPIVRIPAVSIGDGFMNFASKLGTTADKGAIGRYWFSPYDMLDLEDAYRTSLFKKICNIPPDDEVREWRTWSGADETQTTAIDLEEKRLGLRQKVNEARILARKDGGSVILIGAGGNAATELKPETIGKTGLKYLTVLSRWEITPADKDTEPGPNYGLPVRYNLNDGKHTEVHPSRVVRFIGNPIRFRSFWDGWGESVWVEIRDAVRRSDQISVAVAGMVDEAKLDIIRYKGLGSSLSTTEGEDRLVKRMGTVNSLKGIVNALILDMDDEYEQKTLGFQGIKDIQELAMTIMAAVADIPATRLMGRAPQGMNATGDSDMRNYYDRISAGQEIVLGPTIANLDEAMIRSAIGSRPKEMFYKWNPLYQTSDKENSEIEKAYADTFSVYASTGLVPDTALTKIAQAGITERGNFPGSEKAFSEAEADGDVPGLLAEPTPAEQAAEEAALAISKATAADPKGMANSKPRIATKDAQPRSLYVRRDVVNAAEIATWAKKQGFASVVDDMHVTIARSAAAVDWMAIPGEWSFGSQNGEMTINPGGPRLVEPLGKAIVLLFNSMELTWRHGAIIEAGASWDAPEYQPHVTISYSGAPEDLSKVTPYRGKIVLGPEIFEEIQVDIEHGEH